MVPRGPAQPPPLRLSGESRQPMGFKFRDCLPGLRELLDWNISLSLFSLLGILFFGLGLLGLAPFVTAAVMLSQALNQLAGSTSPRKGRLATAGFLSYLLLCLLVQWGTTTVVDRSLIAFSSGESRAIERSKFQLGLCRPFLSSDELASRYWSERDDGVRRSMSKAYEALTGGGDVEKRIWVLRD